MSEERPTSSEYVLGTGLDEHARLGLQHRLWSDAAVEAWRRAGFGLSSRVLDVGCGPGHAALDLAQLVGPSGRVVGVDESAGFIEWFNQQAHSRGLSHARGVVGDVQAMNLRDEGAFDGAYARWVLCFVPKPLDVLRGVAAALKSGGVLVIHDYFNYGSMTTAPRLSSHDALVKATVESWKERGGDPDIAGRLPRLLNEAGFDVVEMRVHQRIARGGVSADGRRDAMLAWPMTWWRTYTPKLVAMGLITQAQSEEALADLARVEADAGAFVMCPPVFEVVGRKAR
jgi:SAM-dependent methyltransferase